ncbi:hypothetical protein BJX64DRAFT_288413 [Aspergillus heterothallicus]
METKSPISIQDLHTLGVAAAHGHIEVLKISLDAGADVDTLTERGHLLWTASCHGHRKTVELLMEYGADTILQYASLTAIDIAREYEREDIEKYILYFDEDYTESAKTVYTICYSYL